MSKVGLLTVPADFGVEYKQLGFASLLTNRSQS